MSDAEPSPAPFVVLDACVLMSTVLRQLLLRTAQNGVFEPVWTERIGEEWRRNAARLWGASREILDDLWDAMNQAFPGAMESDTQAYETGLRYSDAKDFHVIAAGLARRARCGLQRTPVVQVMTWNLKDFNRSELRRQGLDVFSPDVMLARWWQAGEPALRSALKPVEQDYVALGREPLAQDAILHRERLYRLAKLAAA
ncbi:MAG TPA: PIN domain-containing protein [Bordetella sp.]|mgnify:FL=1|uniref:PIN domain-containing protein n=1 Tax=Bordetella sp. TaxID=28081 RepID=UPI002ED05947